MLWLAMVGFFFLFFFFFSSRRRHTRYIGDWSSDVCSSDLADGARVMLQAIGDGSDMRIGAEVELVLRRYALERGVPVYGFKARVVVDATAKSKIGRAHV